MLNIEKNFAWDVMETIGRCSCLHFIDSNRSKDKTRMFTKLVQRCYQALSKIKIITKQCVKYAGTLKSPSSVEFFIATLEKEFARKEMDGMAYFEAIEQVLEEGVSFLSAQRNKVKEMDRRHTNLMEEKYVLTKAADIVLSHMK
jgi:hypothetical protein